MAEVNINQDLEAVTSQLQTLIAELQDLVSKYKRNSGAQLEFNFEC